MNSLEAEIFRYKIEISFIEMQSIGIIKSSIPTRFAIRIRFKVSDIFFSCSIKLGESSQWCFSLHKHHMKSSSISSKCRFFKNSLYRLSKKCRIYSLRSVCFPKFGTGFLLLYLHLPF